MCLPACRACLLQAKSSGGHDAHKEAEDDEETKEGGGKESEDAQAAGGAGGDGEAAAPAAAPAAAVDDVDPDIEAEIAAQMGTETGPKGALSEDDLTAVVDLVYLFSFVWSFGCNLDDNSRAKFSEYVNVLLSPIIPEAVRGTDLFSLFVDTKRMALLPWSDRTPEFVYNSSEPYFNILVPTVDTTRYAYIMQTLISTGRNVLFTGDTGVGKSVIVADTLTRMTTGGLTVVCCLMFAVVVAVVVVVVNARVWLRAVPSPHLSFPLPQVLKPSL